MSGDPWGFDAMNRHSAGDITFWGDSLTAGTGASSAATSMPGLVAGSRTYYNQGVGGNTSGQCLTRVLAGTPMLLSGTTVIWIGINNSSQVSTVESDTAAMVAFLGHRRYIVVGLCNGTNVTEYSGTSVYNNISAINASHSSTYGAHFADVWTPILASAAPAGAYPDATAYANGTPPSAIMYDQRHFNSNGYAIIAPVISAIISANGW